MESISEIQLIIFGIILFIFSFTVFLKSFYKIMAITKVYIPLFYENRKNLKNDILLHNLKTERSSIIFTIIAFFIFVLAFIPKSFIFFITTMLIAITCSMLSFNADIFKNEFDNKYKKYFKE